MALNLFVAGCPAGDGRFITSSADGGGTPQPLQPTFSSIQSNIFTPRCALSGCHAGGGSVGLSLDPDVSYADLVNEPSVERPDLDRVSPGSPDTSYLVKKIEGAADIVGGRMPLNGPPFLTANQIAAIRQWIADGALDDRTASLLGPATSDPGSLRLARAAARVALEWNGTGANDAATVLAESRWLLVAAPCDASDADRGRRFRDAWRRALGLVEPADLLALVELADALEFASDAADAAGPLRRAAHQRLTADPPTTLVGVASTLTAVARLALAGEAERAEVERLVATLLSQPTRTIRERARTAEALAWSSLTLCDDGLAHESRERALSLANEPGSEVADDDTTAAVFAAWNALRVLPFEGHSVESFEPLAERLLGALMLAGKPLRERLVAEAIAAWRPESLALEPTETGWRRRERARR